MPNTFHALAACAGAFAATAADAAQTDPAVPRLAQAILDAAYETGDPAEIAAVAKALKKVFPDYAAAIEDQAAARTAALTPSADPERGALDDQGPGAFALKPWDGKVQAGGSLASGNSDNLAAGVSIDAARTAGPWVHNFKAYLDIAESDGVASQKRWGASYKLDYNFSDRVYAYARFAYDEDEFSGFDYRLFAGAGLGHFLFDVEAFTWKIEGGPGYRYSPVDLTNEVEQGLALYAASETDWTIRNGVILEQDLSATWTSPTTTLQSVSSLRTDLTDAISTAISFEYRYETDPPPGREKADKTVRASLVYGF